MSQKDKSKSRKILNLFMVKQTKYSIIQIKNEDNYVVLELSCSCCIDLEKSTNYDNI